LTFNGVICRHYHRKAPNQFKLLEAFQRDDWPPSIANPLGNPEHLDQTLKDFHKALKPEADIRLFRNNLRAAWEPLSRTSQADLP
jgi:hypothetical protein